MNTLVLVVSDKNTQLKEQSFPHSPPPNTTTSPQYNLDFRGLSPRGRGNSPYRSDGEDVSGSGNNSATGGGSGSEGNM
ncbi:hypothetical protein E2C01_010923 [Portunus trituberculatus]|uniref:Uncharacterized protein n=1 Tax=Portunus trituberculatus TaxID=210409 RepID=A0A5B7D9Q7_PORTR|nr:hypothetical protein [Portunus trituberculatus]